MTTRTDRHRRWCFSNLISKRKRIFNSIYGRIFLREIQTATQTSPKVSKGNKERFPCYCCTHKDCIFSPSSLLHFYLLIVCARYYDLWSGRAKKATKIFTPRFYCDKKVVCFLPSAIKRLTMMNRERNILSLSILLSTTFGFYENHSLIAKFKDSFWHVDFFIIQKILQSYKNLHNLQNPGSNWPTISFRAVQIVSRLRFPSHQVKST